MSGAKSPSVAIVVVNFRTPGLTLACADSLRNLDFSGWQLIVVDNASGDDSVEQLKRGLDEGELIVAKSNGGYTAGNNLGIKHALGTGADYVLVLNPDTVVANPGFLRELVRVMEANPEMGALGPRVFLRESGRVQNTVLKFPWLWRRAVDWVRIRAFGQQLRSGNEPRDAEALNGVCVLFRADALNDVGLFDERTFAYIEDIDWSYRASKKGWQRAYAPVDSVIHLQKEAGYERGSTVDFLLKRNTLYFLMKSGHWLQAAGYTVATLAMTMVHAARSGSLAWSKRLASAYAGLWSARWESCMGRP